MNKQLLFLPLAAVVFTGPRPVQAQSQEPARKITIEVTTTENGETTHIKRELDPNDEQGLQDALREMGIMDEMVIEDGDGEVTIDIRKVMKDAEEASEMALKLTHEALAEHGADRGYLGVRMRSMKDGDEITSKSTGNAGAVVTSVMIDSPAQAAGLEEEDVIIRVDEHVISGPDELSEVIGSLDPGTSVKVAYLRNGKKRTAQVELGERPLKRNAYAYAFDPEHMGQMEKIGQIHGKPGAFLGVTPADEENRDGSGAAIGSVEPASAAEHMGIREGDVIRKFNGQEVTDFEALRTMIGELDPGSEAVIELLRGNEKISLSGALGERKLHRFMFLDEEGGENVFEHEFHFEGMDGMEMKEMRKEMEALRAELDQLRSELGQEVRREVRVRIDTRSLTKEEMDLLKNKGVEGLDAKLELSQLSISPNPSTGRFELKFTSADRGDLKIMVHDATGEKVFENVQRNFSGRYEGSIDLTNSATGAYFLVIQQNGRSATSKLIKE